MYKLVKSVCYTPEANIIQQLYLISLDIYFDLNLDTIYARVYIQKLNTKAHWHYLVGEHTDIPGV